MPAYLGSLHPPQENHQTRLLHEKLTYAGLSIVGCSPIVEEIHPTDSPSTFVPVDGGYVRVDWAEEPAHEIEETA